MPPLIRTTRRIYSNPAEGTVSIYAGANPLMKLMHHNQVQGFVQRNRGTLLSRLTTEICFSYLGLKYVSPFTKTLILTELETRARVEEDAPRIT
ncbi:hypothetical protein B0H19DRAFT_1245318 [Mycena capillaripes]|nr:hypothetical protein B0H19DRAFT_1245318 [Mycena capillaripes]